MGEAFIQPDLCVVTPPQKKGVVKLVKHMFSWIKYMEIISFPAVFQNCDFWVCVCVCVHVSVFVRPWVEV